MSTETLAEIEADLKRLNAILDSVPPPVYFIRCEGYVKIGYSADPRARLKQIKRGTGGALFPPRMDAGASEMVATEPGGFPRERELHAKFAHLRHTGEWFTESKELTDYIEGLAA
jgi:hypothetical protein